MTRRSLFKTLLAAPLAALCFWRKKPAPDIGTEDFTTEDMMTLTEHSGVLNFWNEPGEGIYDEWTGPGDNLYWFGPPEYKTLHVKDRRRNWVITNLA